MAEEVIRRRRVLSDTADGFDSGEVVREDGTSGLGVALAVALAIIAVLALFALARGVFTPAPSTTPNTVQINPGADTVR